MRVIIAPDSFGGTLRADEAATAIADGWRRVRPDDDLVLLPMSDGGEGLLAVVGSDADVRHEIEVAGPHGHPRMAAWLQRPDGSALIESASACGLHLLPDSARTPGRATTYGVGQLLAAAVARGADPIRVGLGGSSSIDGGTGALLALGYRLTVADGSGLKIGGDDLHRLTAIDRGWSRPLDVEVELLADVATPLADAAPRFGPQKGADEHDLERYGDALRGVARVLERDLGADPAIADLPGSGAAGGLGFGLMAALGATVRPGAKVVAELVGLPGAMADADLAITGEGRLDATTGQGKVVAAVHQLAVQAGRPAAAVVGQLADRIDGLDPVEEAAADGPGDDPVAEVAAAAGRLAIRWG